VTQTSYHPTRLHVKRSPDAARNRAIAILAATLPTGMVEALLAAQLRLDAKRRELAAEFRERFRRQWRAR